MYTPYFADIFPETYPTEAVVDVDYIDLDEATSENSQTGQSPQDNE